MAFLHTTPLWTITHPHSNPSSPSTLSRSSFITTGCKSPAIINLQAKPFSASALAARRPGLSARSTSTSSIPQQATSIHIPPPGSKESSSPAIDIPLPALTPYCQTDLDDSEYDEPKEDDDNIIFSSRFQKRRNQHKGEEEDDDDDDDDSDPSQLMHQSSSAPSAISPSQLRKSSTVKTGFTFSSNLLSPTQAKEESDSYDLFVSKMEEDCWKSVSTIRTTYFFDGIGRGGGFLAVSFGEHNSF
ncbi:hypothetical protein EDD21DRAFT_421564 [Dissophora ornata]|nr:hypothetical protein EDD21DRAFT_421564 [Dissophora ornata]